MNIIVSILRRNKQVSLLVIIVLFTIFLILLNYMLMKKREASVSVDEASFQEDVVDVTGPDAGFEPLPEIDTGAVEALSPQEPAVIPSGVFSVQVGSFRKQKSADSIRDTLAEKGYDAYVVKKDLGSKGTWYRIMVGKFKTKQDAQEILDALKDTYKDSFIIQH